MSLTLSQLKEVCARLNGQGVRYDPLKQGLREQDRKDYIFLRGKKEFLEKQKK